MVSVPPPSSPAALLRTLERNRADLLARIAAAAAGRPLPTLVAVTKSVDLETAAALHAIGQREFAESRADELERKVAGFADRRLEARWHFIGPLQKNKVRRVVRVADVVHSIDSPELLERLERIAAEEERTIDVFLEVKLSAEPEKHGFEVEAVAPFLAARGPLSAAVRLRGLMGMAARPDDDGDAGGPSEAFARARALADAILADPHLARAFVGGRCLLSLGMSSDFELAIRVGHADLVRLGRCLFAGLATEDAR